ncbi:MAG: protein jag [Deltaproteobacteria bacterium]|nr:MAG: protein jag [Deltaproteobacteria bacterium]
METYEFEGKTTEEAIENASRELNLPVEDLRIDVIEPGSAGIFGLVGSKKAKIKVRVNRLPDIEEGTRLAKETLSNILALIPVEATVRAEQSNGRINLHIEGDRSGLLIGRKGRTLDALQFIVNKIVYKALDKKLNIVLDSENYRQRKKDSLTQLALKMGEKAKKTKKPVTTNLLNPHDRRIIHLALKDDEDLDTKSRGEGLLKKVVIIPKNK